jgi:hypothetical protein
VADGLIPRNVAATVKAPRPTKKEIRPLSPEQALAFLETAKGDRFEALYVLAIHCSLREGQLLGLKWEDVDLEAGTLAVMVNSLPSGETCGCNFTSASASRLLTVSSTSRSNSSSVDSLGIVYSLLIEAAVLVCKVGLAKVRLVRSDFTPPPRSREASIVHQNPVPTPAHGWSVTLLRYRLTLG